MSDTTPEENTYQKKLEEARKELAGSFSTPLAKTPEESAVKSIKKNETLAGFSGKVLAEKRKEAQEALGATPEVPKKKIYSTLERIALNRAQKISNILTEQEREQERIVTAKENSFRESIVPAKITPDQETFSPFAKFSPSLRPDSRKEVPPPVFPSFNQATLLEKDSTPKEPKSEPVKNSSLVQVAMEEQKRKSALEQSGYYQATRKRQKIILGTASIFIFLGIGLTVYTVFLSKNDIVIPNQNNTSEYIIPPTSIRLLPFNPTETLSSRFVSAVIDVPLPPRTIQALQVVNKGDDKDTTVPLNEVLSALSVSPPQEFIQSLGENYMLGVYGDTSNYAFLITETNSFSTSLGSLLEWEKGSLPSLYNLFTTSTRSPLEQGAVWKDVFIRNIDARVLENRSQDIFLVYSFLDKNTLVITPSISTFLEVADRFRTAEQIIK